MRKKAIVIKFSGPLTEKQEAILIANFKGLLKSIEKELNKRTRQLDGTAFRALMLLPTNRLALGHIKERMKKIRENLTDWFKLYKKDDRTYVFEWQEEDLKLIKKKLSVLGKDIKIEWGDLVKENKLIEGLRRYVLPDMGVKPDAVEFIVVK